MEPTMILFGLWSQRFKKIYMLFNSIINKKFFKKRIHLICIVAILAVIVLSACVIRANIIKEKKSRILIINKSYFQDNSKESETIKKYLGKKNKLYVELPRENELQIVKIKIEQPKIGLISFFQNRENNKKLDLIAKHFSSIKTDNSIILQNINFKNLLSLYQNLTGRPFIDILQIENLSNNFNTKQQETFLSFANNNIDLTIFSRNEIINNLNDFDYIGKIKFNDQNNLSDKVTNFENIIKHILAVQLPVEKKKILPNESHINELIADTEKFVFLDKNINNKNIKYIQEGKLNFFLSYYIKDSKIIFSNSLDKLKNENFANFSQEHSIILIPTKLLNYSNLAKKIFSDKIEKYKNVIFIENPKLKELNLIFL